MENHPELTYLERTSHARTSHARPCENLQIDQLTQPHFVHLMQAVIVWS